jgi:adenylate cyclase
VSKKLIHGILIGAAAAAAALLLWSAGWLNWLEWPLWDLRVRTMARPGPGSDQIRLIYLDQTSLDWGKETQRWPWPWPRLVYTTILDFCKRGGAKAVVFDVLFTESSRDGVEDDQNLGASLAQFGKSVGSVMLSNQQGTTTTWPTDIPPHDLKVEGLHDPAFNGAAVKHAMRRAAFPVPEIATNCAVLGNVYAAPDRDKIIRRVALFHIFDGHFVPSLGLAAHCAANPDVSIKVADNELEIGSAHIPVDRDGKTILRYRGLARNVFKIVSAQAVIQSELRIREGGKAVLDPSFFKDRYVFFALTAPGLLDLRATPFSPVAPGVEIHATMLDNLLSNDFMRDPPRRAVVLLTVLLALLAAVVGRMCRKAWDSLLGLAVFLSAPLALGFVLYRNGFWMPVAVQEVAVAFALVGAMIVNYAVEGRQKRFIKNAFKQYLSPVVIERLTEHPDQLKLGGEARELTIFFSDVRAFTTISEGLDPERLTSLLNDYLTAMSDIIMAEGGTIDKYEGDAIIAFWNAPLDLPGHANNGVRAALLCQRKLAEIRPVLKERYGKEIFVRIGINTGKVVVGNMGSHQRFNYTFLGDAGNLAARLEGINKQFGSSLMISEYTAKLLGPEFVLRELSRVRVVGRMEPVRVFEPMFKADAGSRREILDVFADALKMYYAGNLAEALTKFRAISSQDAPAEAYARRCADLMDNAPQKWDGVWEMKEK